MDNVQDLNLKRYSVSDGVAATKGRIKALIGIYLPIIISNQVISVFSEFCAVSLYKLFLVIILFSLEQLKEKQGFSS